MMLAPEPILARRLGVDLHTAHTLLRIVTHRNPAIRITAVATGIAAFALSFLGLGLLLGTLAAFSGGESPTIAIVLFVVVWVSAFLGETAAARSQARLAAMLIERARDRWQCLHCDYDLAPTLAAGNRTCPECGETALHLADPEATPHPPVP
jgi:hypothetical protein